MMEYLFRGKRKDNGEWVAGWYVKCQGKINPGIGYILPLVDALKFEDGKIYIGGFIEVDPATVGQYTGLMDKHGVKIFDGDVLNVTTAYFGNIEKQRVAVEWNDNIENDSFGEPHTSGYCIHGYDWEIIGNIHDPKLLEATT